MSAVVPAGVPAHAYCERLTTRSYEVGQTHHAHPSMLLRYLEHLATRDSAQRGYPPEWYGAEGTAWLVREMSLWMGTLPGIDAELRMATWLSEFKRVQAYREYAIWHDASGRLVARAQGRWAYVYRSTGRPARVPDAMLREFSSLGPAMRVRRGLPAPSGSASSRMTLRARSYEADTNQHINNGVYADWLAEALAAHASASAPVLRPRYLHLTYLRQVLPGDMVSITTTPFAVRSRRVAVTQEITTATGEPVLRAYAEYLRGAP